MDPARTVETASNVSIVEPLALNATLPSNLHTLNRKLQDLDVYVPVDLNLCMDGFAGWQRFVCVAIDLYCNDFVIYMYLLP